MREQSFLGRGEGRAGPLVGVHAPARPGGIRMLSERHFGAVSRCCRAVSAVDHPRSRGEHVSGSAAYTRGQGSPPLARGARRHIFTGQCS